MRPLPVNAPKSEMDWGGSGYQDAAEIAKKMLAERAAINSRTKLTWNKDQEDRLYATDRMVGEVNLSAPYMRIGTGRPGKFYYIQNCEFYLGNGVKTDLEEITRIESLDPMYGPAAVETLRKAEQAFLADASRRDSALCRHCLHYRAKDQEDYLKHIMTVHPDHAMKVAGIEPEAPEATEPAPIIAVGLECCGKSFKNESALRAHKRFSKTNHGA